MDGDVSHFSMVGFDLDIANEAAFGVAIEKVLTDCELIELKAPFKLCQTSSASGGELWTGVKEDNNTIEITTINPAFRGSGNMRVKVTAVVSDPQWEPFEYQLSVTFGEHDVPVMVDLADPREKNKFVVGKEADLDVTAFTYKPEIYSTVEEYFASQKDIDGIQYAEDYFVPSGLFGNEPTSYASFAGKVIDAELRSNGNSRFWWTLIKTMSDATVNVVFDDVSTEKSPKIGDIVTGDFWLSARLKPLS